MKRKLLSLLILVFCVGSLSAQVMPSHSIPMQIDLKRMTKEEKRLASQISVLQKIANAKVVALEVVKHKIELEILWVRKIESETMQPMLMKLQTLIIKRRKKEAAERERKSKKGKKPKEKK